MPIEVIKAPAGGVNADTAPDYLATNQAADLLNMLPRYGKVDLRGPIRRGTFAHVSDELNTFRSIWFFGDVALYKIVVGGVFKYYKVDLATQTMTDVTASLAKTPYDAVAFGSNPVTRTERYGDAVYGPIDDATNAPALGKWDGNTTMSLMTNAPYKFTDLKVHLTRLWVLGGTKPGTTTPLKSRVLWWTDANTAADLSLTASWTDDVSGLVNEIDYAADDTPVGLAACGQQLAILGSRSIYLLTGSGSSSFAVRAVTKNWGCVSKESIVEVDGGFWFMSDRGWAFCDGTTVTDGSDGLVRAALQSVPTANWTAAALNDGCIVLANTNASANAWMFNQASRTWTRFTWRSQGLPTIACRSVTYPLIFQQGYLGLLDQVTNAYAFGVASQGMDNSGSDSVIPTMLKTRLLKLSAPSSLSTVRRLLVDYAFQVGPGVSSSATHRMQLGVFDGAGNSLLPAVTYVPAQGNAEVQRRQRFVLDLSAETDTVYVTLQLDSTVTPVPLAICELYDIYVEFQQAQNRGTI